MNATLLPLSVESPQTLPSCSENCPAVQRLERRIERLELEYCCDVGLWKSRHAHAVLRENKLKEEVEQLKGEVRGLRAERFGRKSEKSSKSDRSNDLPDPEEAAAKAAAKKKRGAQPGHAGHSRRDYSNLPTEDEDVELPLESRLCPHCGKLAAEMSDTEDSE